MRRLAVSAAAGTFRIVEQPTYEAIASGLAYGRFELDMDSHITASHCPIWRLVTELFAPGHLM